MGTPGQLKEILANYIDYLKEDGKQGRTIESYASDVEAFLQHVARTSGRALEALEREDMLSFRKALLKRKLKPATVNKAVNSVSCFCQWLKETRVLPPDRRVVEPRKDRVKVAYGSEPEVEVFSDEQVGRILDYVAGPYVTRRNRLIVHLLLYTGCRVSELVDIRLDDIDRDTRTLTLRGKGNKLREVPLKQRLIELVEDYQTKERTRSPHADSEHLLISDRAPRMHRDSVNTMLEQMEKKAMFDFHLRPHKFRHTFCTRLISRGVPLTTVSKSWLATRPSKQPRTTTSTPPAKRRKKPSTYSSKIATNQTENRNYYLVPPQLHPSKEGTRTIELREMADLQEMKGHVAEGVFDLAAGTLSDLLSAYDVTRLEDDPVVVLEPEKDDWKEVLDWRNPMWVEYAETLTAPDGSTVHKVVKLFDNHCVRIFFAQAGQNSELDLWVRQFTEDEA